MSKVPFTLRLDGEMIWTEADFHAAIKEQSGIEWYGCNLDALNDRLFSIIPIAWGPFRIVWDNADLSWERLRQRYLMIVGLLKEAEERLPDRFIEFRMTFKTPYFDEGQDPFSAQ